MKDLSYEVALAELQAILQALQEEQIGIDELATKSRRAAELIQYCREKLRNTEKELTDLFGE